MRIDLQSLASVLNLGRQNSNPLITGVSTDNRQCSAGDLFVCIQGERTDGHLFASDAVARGAVAVLASRPLPEIEVPVLVVPDPVAGLGAMAAAWRKKTPARVVCITGTAGKTTLKEALRCILALAGKTIATPGNHNNQLGMPLTILSSDGDEDFWVLEAGINRVGDMDELGAMAEPDLALILNVGPGHTEGLGSNVAIHKAKLLEYLRPGGVGIISSDYPELLAAAQSHRGELLRFCCDKASSAEFRSMTLEEPGNYRLWLGNHYLTVKTEFVGAYGAEIAIAAAAAASLLGIADEAIARGLAEFEPPAQRFRLFQHNGWLVFDDTYNANPLSMNRMLETAAARAEELGLPFYAVLGEMGELGALAVAEHEKLGRLLRRLSPAQIFWKGDYAPQVEAGLGSAGLLTEVQDEPEFFQVAEELARRNGREGVILFKGSRKNRMDRLLDGFMEMTDRARHVL